MSYYVIIIFFKLIYFFVSYPFLWHEWNKIGTSDFIFSIGLVIFVSGLLVLQ